MGIKIKLKSKYFKSSGKGSKIETVIGREILDSRGNPTIEVDVILKDGTLGRAAVPSGASTGKREALELRDDDKKRYMGKGVLKAVSNVGVLGEKIQGMNVLDQVKIDQYLLDIDASDNKMNYGANAILGISLAVARAAANHLGIPLYNYINNEKKYTMPVPMMNVMNGGAHAGWNTEIQEYMIMPIGATSFTEALRMGAEIYHNLKKIVKNKGYSTTVGDEGGFAPAVDSNEKSIGLIMEAIEAAGYKAGKDVALALDCAASEFYKDGVYNLKSEKKKLSSKEMVELYKSWCKKYPIISIEDGLSEDDWAGWAVLTKELGGKIMLVGDDLFVTNKAILKEGIDKKIGNSILIKVNQIGSLSETLETIELAKANGYKYIISHRSGETDDTTISDLAVATSSGYIKTGAPARTDRVAKYNQLLRIEQILEDKAIYNKIKL